MIKMKRNHSSSFSEKEKAKMIRNHSNSFIVGHVPEEIVFQILVRLPVKFILKFMTVCRSWYGLIKSPVFINTHLNYHKNKTTSISTTTTTYIFLKQGWLYHEAPLISITHDDVFSSCSYFPSTFPLPDKGFTFHGCCNGVVCFSTDSTVYLWNRALGILKALPPPNINASWDLYDISIAFGFDHILNDYKVVRIVQPSILPPGSVEPSIVPPRSIKVELYYLSTNSWRNLDDDALVPSCSIMHWPPVVINGVVHWLADKKPDYLDRDMKDSAYFIILRFDLKDEVFSELMIPVFNQLIIWDQVFHMYPIYITAGPFESLCFFHLDLRVPCWNIWTIQRKGTTTEPWKKLSSMNIQRMNDEGGAKMWPMVLTKDSEVLLLNFSKDLFSRNLVTGQVKEVGIHGLPMLSVAHHYLESLILLDGNNKDSEAEQLVDKRCKRLDEVQPRDRINLWTNIDMI